MTLDLTRQHKRAEFTIKISANRQSTINGGEEFFTMDSGGTAVGIFNFELEDENGGFKKLNLTGIKNILIGFDFTVVDSKVVLEPEILDAENGRVALVLPNQYEYSGLVLGYTYIIWEDGREQDGGTFQLTFTESWLDKELPEMEDFYVSRFEDLAEEIRRRVEEIKVEMDRDLKTVKQDLTTAQSDINKIQSQIDDNDIVRQVELDSAGFGENNLIRNSHIPVVINPAGNLTTATQLVASNLDLDTDYGFSTPLQWLRGGSTQVLVRLFESSSEATISGSIRQTFLVDIVNNRIELTFKTPSSINASYLHLAINAGTTPTNNQGNTLQLTKPMLTKGTKPQPYHPAHEDNTERLDNIETLKPITKRTIATFEGKVAESVVANPHVAHRLQSTTTLAVPSSTTMTAFTQANYNSVMLINNSNVRTVSSGTENALVQHRFTFNIIAHLEKEYSTAIWQGYTALADKVRIAKQIVKRITCHWHGFGTTNNTHWSGLTSANSLTTWGTGLVTSTSGVVTRVSRIDGTQSLIDTRILSDGTVRYLAHTALEQTTPIGGASLTTEFVQFEVDVETTLASTDWSYSKAETDRQLSRYLPLTGGTLTGDLTRGYVRIGNDWIGTHNATAFHVRSGTNRTAARFGEGNLDMHVGASSLLRVFQINSTSIFRPVRALNFQTANGNTRLTDNRVGNTNASDFYLRRGDRDVVTVRSSGITINTNASSRGGGINIEGATATGYIWAGNPNIILESSASNGGIHFRTGGTDTAKLNIGVNSSTFSHDVAAPNFRGRLTGNADTVTRLQTARNITLSGDTTGSTTTDLSGNVTINTKSANRTAVNLINSQSYSRVVIGLCLVEPNNAHPASHAIGRLMRIRNNGNNILGWYDVSFAKRYNSQRPDVTFLRAGTTTLMRPCTFMYNGQKWAGLQYEIDAQYHWLRFTGEASEEIFTIAYARTSHANASPAPNAVVNAEINDSINFTDFNLQSRFEFNGNIIPVAGNNTVYNMTVTRATSLVTKSGKEVDISDELTTCQNELQECKAEIAELKTMMREMQQVVTYGK